MVSVGIYGGSGYMGGEVLRIILKHPEAKLSWVTSRDVQFASHIHPNFIPSDVKFITPRETSPCDVVFIAAPTGVAMEQVPQFLGEGTRVIDLGADFRLRDRDIWERLYKRKHQNWSLCGEAVYGIPELHRQRIATARLIANPGCFSSAAIFALAPLVAANLIETSLISIVGLSGTAGMGAEQSRPSHHPEIANNVVPYNVVDHRHTYEIEQELRTLRSEPVAVHFTPAYVPISRGILNISSVFPKATTTRVDVLAMFREFYKHEMFVKVHDAEKETDAAWDYRAYPWISAVSGTNFCLLGIDYDEHRNRLVLFSVLDSMGKGGAHAAVQNMNIMFGLPEHLGIENIGLHPY